MQRQEQMRQQELVAEKRKEESKMEEIKIPPYNKDNLYSVELISDTAMSNIEHYKPVKLTKEFLRDVHWLVDDPSRKHKFFSTVNIQWNGHVIPGRFDIPAESLSEAIDKFPSVAETFVKNMVQDLDKQATQAMLMGKGKPRINNGQPLPKPR